MPKPEESTMLITTKPVEPMTTTKASIVLRAMTMQIKNRLRKMPATARPRSQECVDALDLAINWIADETVTKKALTVLRAMTEGYKNTLRKEGEIHVTARRVYQERVDALELAINWIVDKSKPNAQ
jgi:hypothetical protein